MTHKTILLLLTVSSLLASIAGQSSVPKSDDKSSSFLGSSKGNSFNLESELSKLNDVLASGNIAMISSLAGGVANNGNIDCKDKANYLSKAMELLRKKMTTNQQYMKSLQSGQALPLKSGSELKTMLTTLKKNLIQKNYESDIKVLLAENKNYTDEINRYTGYANDELNKLREMKKVSNLVTNTNKEQNAILKLESELQSLDKLINETSKKRSELHKNMTAVKINLLNQEIKAREGTSQKKYEADYRQYSELALQANQRVKEKEDEISKLKAQLNNKQQTPTTVDDQIQKITKQLQQKKGLNDEKALELINNANKVLSENQKNIDIKISILSSECII